MKLNRDGASQKYDCINEYASRGGKRSDSHNGWSKYVLMLVDIFFCDSWSGCGRRPGAESLLPYSLVLCIIHSLHTNYAWLAAIYSSIS